MSISSSFMQYAAPLVTQRKTGYGQNGAKHNQPMQIEVSHSNLNALKQNPKFFRTKMSLDRERKNRSIRSNIDANSYELFQNQNDRNNKDSTRLRAFAGIHEANELNQTFMSPANMDLIQQQIRYEVYKRSNHRYLIDRQDNVNLQIIMRSIFLQYAKNNPCNIKQQIVELNRLVIKDAVPKILSTIVGYQGYLVDASRNPMPLSHPQSMNSAGRKTLPSVTRTFFSS